VAHHLVRRTRRYFEQVIRFLIMGNVRRATSIRCALAPSACCRRRPSRSGRASSAPMRSAHGSTAAGNDQVRFEVATAHARARARDPGTRARPRVQAPEQLAYLQERKLPVPPFGARIP